MPVHKKEKIISVCGGDDSSKLKFEYMRESKMPNH